MSGRIMAWTAIQFSRRRFLKVAAASAFGAFAGFGLRPQLAYAASCTGPGGSGYCGAAQCNGAHCKSPCHDITGYCPGGGACWSDGSGGTCCDCFCVSGNMSWYCYCHA